MKKYNFNIVLHPSISIDLQEALDYYNSKQNSLGNRLYRLAKSQINLLKTDGLLYPEKYDNVRCVKVNSFPYLIHYRVDKKKNQVFADAVINTSKDPKINWGKRK